MKDHERIFFALCFGLRNIFKPRDVVNILGETIPHNRCWYYLKKWDGLGFYNYGVTLDLGWFELDKIPPRYMEITKEINVDKLARALERYLIETLHPVILAQGMTGQGMTGLLPR